MAGHGPAQLERFGSQVNCLAFGLNFEADSSRSVPPDFKCKLTPRFPDVAKIVEDAQQ